MEISSLPNGLFSEDVFDFRGLKEAVCWSLAQNLCRGAQGSATLWLWPPAALTGPPLCSLRELQTPEIWLESE